MKSIIKYFIILVMMNLGGSVTMTQTAHAQAEVSFQIFYDQLSPYGHWVSLPEEGYVWVPEAGPDFSPYATDGYWIYTDYGWMWVSDYPWGWAPFHYGRWDIDDEYGWYWVPDYQWAPAWVAWSESPGYYGWAPLRPGIEVNYAITNGYYFPPEHWHYVPDRYMGHRDIARYYAPRSENATHIRSSTMINKTYIDNNRHTTYIGGPPREDVEKATGAPIKPLTVAQRQTPGQSISRNQVSIYRPVVARTTSANPAPAPTKVATINDIKPQAGRAQSQQRMNTPPPAQSQQPQQRNIPPSAVPPATRQNERTPPQATPQNPKTEPRVQPPVQQNAPKNIPPPETPQTNRTPPQQSQQPPQQRQAPQRDRIDRYAPPHYQAPKANTPPPQPVPRPEPSHQPAPPRQAPPMPQHQPQSHGNKPH